MNIEKEREEFEESAKTVGFVDFERLNDGYMEPVWLVMVELALIVLLGVVGVIWSLQ